MPEGLKAKDELMQKWYRGLQGSVPLLAPGVAMTKPWQSETRGRSRREGKSGPREQGTMKSNGSWGTVSGKQVLSWGPLCPQDQRAWACLAAGMGL